MSLDGYLGRLGVEPGAPPTLETLRLLHHRHLERIPYENLHIMLGRPPSAVPDDSLARVAGLGRAGYCFHLNGAFELLLTSLGFDVERRHGHVWSAESDRLAPGLTHLALVVHGLPSAESPSGSWWADVGLGDGFHDPLPLVPGDHDQSGWRYRLEVDADRWSFHHDPLGSFTGVEMTRRDVDGAAVGAAHAGLAADSGFTRLLVVQRRDAAGSDTVRGCLLLRIEPGRRDETELTSYDDWRGALADHLGLPLDDVPDDELRDLWVRTRAAHQTWDAAGRP